MFRKLKIAAISALLGLGTLAGMPASAQADGIYFSFGNNGRAGGYFEDRDYRPRHHRPRHVRTCTPDRALQKAERMGLRRVRVVNANRNIIRVVGRSHRYGRASIVFARAPHCPVIRAM